MKDSASPSPVRTFPRRAKKEAPHPYLAFGSALVFLRQRAGKMQSEIAQEARLTKSMLSSYETGRNLPALESLFKLLEALGADFRDLQDARDILANRPAGRTVKAGEQEMDRERRIGRAVLDVATAFGEAMRDESSAPQLRIAGSIGGSRLMAG